MREREYWSQYWLQGHKTSFGSVFTDCYQGVLRQEWQNIFAKLRPEQSVLDLCTGNASLLRLAQQTMNDFGLSHFTGVDYADVPAADEFSCLANVSLHFPVNIEQLPFADSSFDLVISNFGVEYSDLDKSLAQIKRVLKPNGQIEFICHYQSSHIIQSNSQDLAIVEELLRPGSLVDNLEGLIIALVGKEQCENDADLHSLEQQAEQCRQKLNTQLANAVDKFGDIFQQGEFFAFLRHVLKKDVSNKLALMKDFRAEQQGHQARLTSLVNAALTEDRVKSLAQYLANFSLTLVDKQVLSDECGVIAIKISARKRDM